MQKEEKQIVIVVHRKIVGAERTDAAWLPVIEDVFAVQTARIVHFAVRCFVSEFSIFCSDVLPMSGVGRVDGERIERVEFVGRCLEHGDAVNAAFGERIHDCGRCVP